MIRNVFRRSLKSDAVGFSFIRLLRTRITIKTNTTATGEENPYHRFAQSLGSMVRTVVGHVSDYVSISQDSLSVNLTIWNVFAVLLMLYSTDFQ